MTFRLLSLATLLVLATACQAPTRSVSPAATASRSDAWKAFTGEFVEAYFRMEPQSAVRAGRHEFDGMLPDLSPEGMRKSTAFYHAYRDRAAAFDAASLTPQQRFEREDLLAQVDGTLFWREEVPQYRRNPGYYGWMLGPDLYLEREYAPLEARMRAFIKYAGNIPRAAASVRENLQAPLPRTYVQLGHIIFGGLAKHFETDVPHIFAPVANAALQEELKRANAGAIRAMRDLDAWMKTLEPTATNDFAIGAEKFRRMLWATERVDTPIAKLKEMGERDLARNLGLLLGACAKFAKEETVKTCVDRVNERKPAEGPVAAAQKQLVGLRQFIIDHKVVTIPSPELAFVREAPPHRRWNAAYISTPGIYEKNLPSYYYIAPPDPSWTPAEQQAYIPGLDDLLFISSHEVWPGHFLQHLHANRAPSTVQQLFRSYAFSEGWAHYAEEMMWDEGLGEGDPAVHIGQLTNALLRDVRYLSAIGLHTGGMTVAESEAMFREKAFQDAGNARQQAARGTFDPAYLNYTLGKLMIRELRDDWIAKHGGGGREAWMAFHDRFLSYGSPPIPLVRKAMMGEQAFLPAAGK